MKQVSGNNGDSGQKPDAPTDEKSAESVEDRKPICAVMVGMFDDGKIFFSGNPPVEKQREATLEECAMLLYKAHRYIEVKTLMGEVLSGLQNAANNIGIVAVRTALDFVESKANQKRIITPPVQ